MEAAKAKQEDVQQATHEDEEKMDRAAQSGAEGAFGSEPISPTRTQMAEDAHDAFRPQDDSPSVAS
ncbi:MAG: hypothetical protein NVSMB42_24900 [Herpetosiphon sp.]